MFPEGQQSNRYDPFIFNKHHMNTPLLLSFIYRSASSEYRDIKKAADEVLDSCAV